MIVRTLLATFAFGCAIGAGAVALLGRRAAVVQPQPQLQASRPPPEDRPIVAGDFSEFPDALSLRDVYDRVSHF